MPSRFALGEIGKIVIHGGDFDEPVRLNVRHRPDVILGGEDEFVVQNPFGFVIQTSRRMQLDHLVVLDGQIMTRPLQMSDLNWE